jgi:hypothetical protein
MKKRFRCSSVPVLLACPGSSLLIPRVTGGKDTSASLLGQWCHYMAAKRLVDEYGAIAPEGGLVAPVMPEGWEPSGFHRWMVDFYVSVCLDYAHVDMALMVEQEFEAEFDRFTLPGHADFVGITADATEAVGADFKSGSDPVDEAEQNSQYLAYIVNLVRAWPTLRKITWIGVQPQNNPDEGMERVTSVTIEGEQLAGVVDYLERELNYAIDHERELNSDGYKQCRYCPAAKQCPAVDGDIKMKLKLTDEDILAIKSEPSAERLLELEFARKKLEPIFESANAELRERARTAGTLRVGEYSVFLETKSRGSEITDNAKAAEALSDLSDEHFHSTYKHSVAAIDKALAAHESARTGQKVPIETKVPGKASGKGMRKERLGPILKQLTAEWLRIVS